LLCIVSFVTVVAVFDECNRRITEVKVKGKENNSLEGKTVRILNSTMLQARKATKGGQN
jgi:murein L,D-transpeptidase YafK